MTNQLTKDDLETLRRVFGGPMRPALASDMASALGLSPSTYSQWENRGPSKTAWAQCRLLCIDKGLLGAGDDFRAWLDKQKGTP